MSSERDKVARPDTAPAPEVQRAAVEVAVPAAPMPLPAAPEAAGIGSLVVGHAEDRAEADADQMADVALSRLRRLEVGAGGVGADVDAHQHGPGCDHLRRSPAPSGAPVVGYEGGALDSGTSSAIESRRGAGRPLDAEVRRRMEGAFGASFSGVRVHADDTAAKLNSAVSARAFTTGKDVFFGKGQYAPGTPSGDRVLAHELAHTLQPAGAAHRLLATAAPGVSPRAQAAIMRSIAPSQQIRRGFFDRFRSKKKEEEPAKAAPVAAAPPAFAGKGGKLPSNTEERGKAAVVGTVVGGSQVAAMATARVASAASAASPLGGLVGTSAGLLTTGDALMGLRNADLMAQEGEKHSDFGMSNLAGRKAKNQGMQALGGAIGTAKGGVEMGYLASTGATGLKDAVASGVGNAALGVAAGGLGVATGSVQTLQGLWKSGKAIQKLCRMQWGRAKTMYSNAGKTRWKDAVVGAEQFKLGVAAVKTALGVLGIAAGALLIVSNPIGWGIGIAAALVGGAYAISKIVAKVTDASNRTKIAAQIAGSADPSSALGVAAPKKVGKEAAAEVAASASRERIATNTATSTVRAGKKNEMLKKGPGVGDEEASRIAAIEKANEVARQASHYAVIASEMRERVIWGEEVGGAGVFRALSAAEKDPKAPIDQLLADEAHRELFDAYMLLSSINVDRTDATSASGQELIEKKLSKMESM